MLEKPMTAEEFIAAKKREYMLKSNRTLTDFSREYLTVENVAKNLKVSEMTILRKIYSGEIEAYRFGRVWRIPADLYSGSKGVKV